MKCSAIQCAMLTESILYPLLQQMFKMASLWMGTSMEMSSPFSSSLIDNCLLNARPDHTQMLQFFFKCLKIIQSGLIPSHARTHARTHTHTHTHTHTLPFNGLYSSTPRVSTKPTSERQNHLDFKEETDDGGRSGITWTVCKSFASHSI